MQFRLALCCRSQSQQLIVCNCQSADLLFLRLYDVDAFKCPRSVIECFQSQCVEKNLSISYYVHTRFFHVLSHQRLRYFG